MTRALSIDIGTSAVKLEVLDDQGESLAAASESYRYILLPGEGVELAPDDIVSAIRAAARRIKPDLLGGVGLVCYDTFSPSPVFMGEDGKLVYPNIITHLDRRSRPQSAWIDEHIGREQFLRTTGLYPFVGGAGVMTLLWMAQNHPEVIENTDHVGHLTTYLHHLLTGTWMVDLVNASMLGTYETTTQSGWADGLVEELGLPRRIFGEIRNPGEAGGALTPQAAALLGVPAGIPVAIGTNDMAAAQVGAGNRHAGAIMNTAGSSDMVSVLTDQPAVDPRYYLRNAAVPGLWQIYATTAGGFALEWFREQFCREFSTEQFYEVYLPRVLDLPDRGTVTFAPYLTGDRQSLEKRTGGWSGLTLGTTRDDMLRATLTSMNQVLRQVVDLAAQHLRLDRTIKVTGGLCQPAILKLKQSVFEGYEFQVLGNCSTQGNFELARMGGVG